MTALGTITGNDPAGFTRFASWLGHKPALALLALDPTKPDLSGPWIAAQGAAFRALGTEIEWSVPFPAGDVAGVNAGTYDELFRATAHTILSIYPAKTTFPILLRMAWEFNLPGTPNYCADPKLFVSAFKRMATAFRNVSARFCRIWCPDADTPSGVDIEAFWPGVDYCEMITQDFYLQKAYDHDNIFSYFRDKPYGLAWGASFAVTKGKPYGLSEWGMDDDQFVPDLQQAVAWLAEVGPTMIGGSVHHHNWWDRDDGGIACEISNGERPAIGAAYKAAVG